MVISGLHVRTYTLCIWISVMSAFMYWNYRLIFMYVITHMPGTRTEKSSTLPKFRLSLWKCMLPRESIFPHLTTHAKVSPDIYHAG